MKKSIVLLALFALVGSVFSDGGEEQKVRRSRFESYKDAIQDGAPAQMLSYFPEGAKGRKLMFMDTPMYKKTDMSFLLTSGGKDKPASDFTKVSADIVMVGAEMGEMMIDMQLGGIIESVSKDMERELKSAESGTKEASWSRMRIFFEASAGKSKSYPKANVRVQKWETDDISPKQTWYDCYYVQKNPASAVMMRILAVPDLAVAEKIFSEMNAKVLASEAENAKNAPPPEKSEKQKRKRK